MSLPQPVILPERIGELTVVRVVGEGVRRAKALVRCPHGHEEWRLALCLSRTVRRGTTTRCSQCPAPVTPEQSRVLQAIDDAGRISRWHLERKLLKPLKGPLENLEAKGWISKFRHWWQLTESGREQIRRSEP